LDFYFQKEGSVNASAAIMNTDRSNTIIKCHVDTIDNYFQENNLAQLDFIKCDIEGAEFFAFQGGKNTIAEYKPVIFTEMLRKWSAKFEYHPNDIIMFFKEMGYNCYYATHNNLREIKTITDETMETNFFFLHENKHKNIIFTTNI